MARDHGIGVLDAEATSPFLPIDLSGQVFGTEFFTGLGASGYHGRIAMDTDMSQLWTTRDWNWMQMHGW